MSDQEPEDELARSDREWAAQASQFPAASTPGAPPASVAPGAGPAVGSGGGGGGGRGPAGTTGTTRPAGPKPVRGPKGNAMGWLRGLGLLSVLLTIGIMAFLSWRVLSDTGGDDVDVVRDPGPAASASPADPLAGDTSTGEAQLGDGGSTDRAAAATCETNRLTVETASEAYAIMNGAAPANLQQLIDSGLLVPDGELQVEITATGEVVSTGTCAGG